MQPGRCLTFFVVYLGGKPVRLLRPPDYLVGRAPDGLEIGLLTKHNVLHVLESPVDLRLADLLYNLKGDILKSRILHLYLPLTD